MENEAVAMRKGTKGYRSFLCHAQRMMGETKKYSGLDESIMLHEVNTQFVENLKKDRQSDNLSNRTINAELTVIKVVYNYYKRLGNYRVANSFSIQMLPVRKNARALTEDEYCAVLDKLKPELYPQNFNNRLDNFQFFQMLFYTGLRYSELAQLPWSWVSQDNTQIHVFRSKTNKQDTLYLSDTAIEILKARRNRQPFAKYVFSNKSGGPRRQINTPFRKAYDAVGINSPENVKKFGHRSLHSLRDTYATALRKRGVPLDQIQKMLGHANMTMTMKYADIDVADVSRNIRNVIEGFVK